MKTLTEIAIECGAEEVTIYNKSVTEPRAPSYTSLLYAFEDARLQSYVDAVNARDSEPVGVVVEYRNGLNAKDKNGEVYKVKHIEYDASKVKVGDALYTSPQPDQSAHIKRLEEQIKRLTNATESVLAVVESSLYLDDEELHNLQNKLEQALASKGNKHG